jgi:SAM-dependent methyltransferase
MDEGTLYAGDYVNSTYGDDGMRRAFARITALEPGHSDNAGRVSRILAHAASCLSAPAREHRPPTVLDVGSGLCVFLHRMKSAGWEGLALDPDERAVRHAREVAGIQAVCGDFLTVRGLGQFDAVTFNKVLEHVRNPVAMLARSTHFLRPGGFVYVEVPDGEAAALEGPNREEFFIEHHHVFSAASLALLAGRAGLSVRVLERLQEPSTKYTLRAFLAPAQRPAACGALSPRAAG